MKSESFAGRLMGLDYGEKRIGIAMSDPMRILATPSQVLTRTEISRDLAALKALAESEGVTAIVLGLPTNTDGSEGEMVVKVRAFAAQLEEALKLPLHFMDETYSSLEADAMLRTRERDWRKRKAKRDMFAAQVILRAWMDHYL
ncbi:MAG: Holliday junction resolvase RuvX [Planctomycetota bacterium]